MHASATFYFSSLIHHIQYITCQVPLSYSVQKFWGNGGPDNSRYEDTCAELSAWSRGLCWGQGQEERKWGTEPNTQHRKGWAGESSAFVEIRTPWAVITYSMLWQKKITFHFCVLSPLCKQNLSDLILSLFILCHCSVTRGHCTHIFAGRNLAFQHEHHQS